MAKNTRLADAAKVAATNAVTALLGAGALLRIYAGAQPATPDDAIGASVLLVELALAADAFGDADTEGVATANAIADGDPVAAGEAAWCSLVKADGTRIIDGSVGTAAGEFNLVLGSTTITLGVPVSISALTFQFPTQGA